MGAKLFVLFADGLDYHFVRRNHDHSQTLARLFPQPAIHRVEGVVHSLQCISQVFAGWPLKLLQYEDRESVPDSERIINWDFLLSRVRKEQILWNRLNQLGHRVGLVEMLGVFLSPSLEGFSITKNVEMLGIGELFQYGLTNYPPQIGDRLKRCREIQGPCKPPRLLVRDAQAQCGRQISELSSREAFELITRCGYCELLGVMGDNLQKLLNTAAGVSQQFPVEVVMMHTGYLDSLLHFFLNRPRMERRVMGLLDRLLDLILEAFDPDELLVFSDHGMRPTTPHLAQGLVHLTDHEADSALIMASGPGAAAYLEAHPPRDLTAVYQAVLHSLDPASGQHAVDTSPLPPEVAVSQMQEVVADRDRLLRSLSQKASRRRQAAPRQPEALPEQADLVA